MTSWQFGEYFELVLLPNGSDHFLIIPFDHGAVPKSPVWPIKSILLLYKVIIGLANT